MRVFLLGLVSLGISGCAPAGPAVLEAAETGILEQSGDIEGRDGGSSAVIFGQSVWVYGDTVLQIEDDHGQTWHHNSVSLTHDRDASDGITGFDEPREASGAPRHFIPPNERELAFNLAHAGENCAETPCGARWAIWPGAPLWDGHRGLVFYGLIYGEPGDFNFHGVGQSIAAWTSRDSVPERPQIGAHPDHPDLMWLEDEPGFGAAAHIHAGHVYAFACDGGIAKSCIVGRAPVGEALDRAAWRYFDGCDWGPKISGAAELFDGAPIMSVSFNAHLGAFFLVYSTPFAHEIVARTAPELWGPWSDESVIYVAPEERPPYDAVHHAELEEQNGRIQYITYSRHTTGWFGTEFPIIRVELE